MTDDCRGWLTRLMLMETDKSTMKSSTTWCQDSEIFLCQHIKIFVLWSWTQSCLYILSYLHVCARLMFTFIHWTNGIRYSIIVNINKQSAGNIISGQFSDTSCRLIFCQITDRIIICIRHDCGGPIIILRMLLWRLVTIVWSSAVGDETAARTQWWRRTWQTMMMLVMVWISLVWWPRMLSSSSSCSCSGPTPWSWPTEPGTRYSTLTERREQTCGGEKIEFFVLKQSKIFF